MLKLVQRRSVVDALKGLHCLTCLLMGAAVVLAVFVLVGPVLLIVAYSHQGPVVVEPCKVLVQEWSLKLLWVVLVVVKPFVAV